MWMRLNHLPLLAVLVCCGFASAIVAEEPPVGAKPPAPASLPTGVRLILPPVIYAAPGVEANLYFDNICLVINPRNYVFDVDAGVGQQQQERWTFLPTDKEVGDHPLTVSIRDERNAVLATGKTIVHVAAANAGADKPLTLLCIGDSLTHASVYPKSILDSCQKPGNPQLQLVGSHWPGVEPGLVRHEGYGGWTALRFATHFTDTARTGDYSKRGSPFLYRQPDGQTKLDFKRYCQDVNGGKFPDLVTIFLGPNDIFSYQDDSIDAGIDQMFKHYAMLVQMIRDSSPSTHIGVMLPVPPAATQDAFGSNYKNGQTRWQYKRNQHRLVEILLDRYGRRATEEIDFIPTHVNLDCEHNYPTAQTPATFRATDAMTRLNNGVHPNTAGYEQIGDSVYCWIKATAGKN